jgi:hypothetical protein
MTANTTTTYYRERSDNPWVDERAVALFAAVIHHGLSNTSPKSIPAGADKVIETARKFEHYLNE